MVGDRLRELRQTRHLSLNDVASKVGISASTLSRIETNKQELDLAIFIDLARILGSDASSILDGDRRVKGDPNPLATQIAALDARSRVDLWRELASKRRSNSSRRRTPKNAPIAQYLEELLAQIDFLREQIEFVRAGTRRRR